MLALWLSGLLFQLLEKQGSGHLLIHTLILMISSSITMANFLGLSLSLVTVGVSVKNSISLENVAVMKTFIGRFWCACHFRNNSEESTSHFMLTTLPTPAVLTSPTEQFLSMRRMMPSKTAS